MYTKLTDHLEIVNGVLEWGSIEISLGMIFFYGRLSRGV